MREITMSTTVLAGLLAAAKASAFSRADQVLLNPQPLPPREERSPWPGPSSADWASVAQAVVARHLERLEQAGIILLSGDVEHVVRRSSQDLVDFASELVGDTPGSALRSWPRNPAAGEVGSLQAVDLILAGIELQQAADALPEHPLAEALERSAAHLLDVGVQRAGVS